MFEMSGDLKTIIDIGFGALALVLWVRQGKINKAQLDLDSKQNKTTEDLVTMVKDHEDRIRQLESRPPHLRGAARGNGKKGH